MFIITKNRRSIVYINNYSFYITQSNQEFLISIGRNGELIESLGRYPTLERARGVLLEISQFIEGHESKIFAMPLE